MQYGRVFLGFKLTAQTSRRYTLNAAPCNVLPSCCDHSILGVSV